MKFMSMARKGIALAVLSLALVFPAGAFAAEPVIGTTPETLTGPAVTISMTVPASATYTLNGDGATYDAPIALTGLTTNSPNGMTVNMTASLFSSLGSPTVPTTVRSRSAVTDNDGNWTQMVARSVGFYTGATFSDRIATTAGLPLNSTLSFTMSATASAFNAGAVYSGTLGFTASTN